MSLNKVFLFTDIYKHCIKNVYAYSYDNFTTPVNKTSRINLDVNPTGKNKDGIMNPIVNITSNSTLNDTLNIYLAAECVLYNGTISKKQINFEVNACNDTPEAKEESIVRINALKGEDDSIYDLVDSFAIEYEYPNVCKYPGLEKYIISETETELTAVDWDWIRIEGT